MAKMATTTLDGLVALLTGKDRAKLGHNTEAVRYADGGIGVFLHATTGETEVEFDMDADAALQCLCGFVADSDQMLDHLVEYES